jgi:hypothetical protein
MGMETAVAAVIGDIVRSRGRADRATTQAHLEEALGQANARVPHLEPLRPTAGDEFQGLFAAVEDAVRATLLVRAHLRGGVDCRFGIGLGERTPLPSVVSNLQDGSAWWSAREAIVEVKSRETAGSRGPRTWFTPLDGIGPNADLLNAYLVSRDELVSRLDDRGKRIMLNTMDGLTQSEIARREGVTQSAVSQSIARNGIHAILAGAELAERRR